MASLIPLFIRIVDYLFKFIPYKKPEGVVAKLVAHRGWHNKKIMENTLKAFETAQKNGIWGIEFDIRWTKDLVPVVHHDPDCERVWGRELKIAQVTFEELRLQIPEIPTLEEVVSHLGKKIHFFIELKWEHFPDVERQNKSLMYLLKDLEPGQDYHLITLEPRVFEAFTILPREFKFLVATTNMSSISDKVLGDDFGGVFGHFLLLSKSRLADHLRQGQKVGTGYARSPNIVYRELARGVEYIFTNHPWNLLETMNQP